MSRRPVLPGFLALTLLAGGGRAHAQGDVLYPGSTVQGDILRGQGVAYKGAAVFYLNAAKARSIDADTQIRFNEYVYQSYQEYLRQRALRIARTAAGRNASLAEIQRRLRERPTESDLASGDALNVVLADLADPRLPATAWEGAKVSLPKEAARTIPFQYASVGGTLALGRLDVGESWPVALRYKALEEPRRAYQRAVSTLLEQCRGHRLTPEAVEAVGAAAKDLGSRAEAVIPPTSPNYRQVARQFTGSLGRSARALTGTTYVEDLLVELDGFKGSTVADLVDLMRRYNLHFGPTEAPDERGLYQSLYPMLVNQRKALGIDAGGRYGVRPPEPSAPEVGRPAVGPTLVGVWSRVTDKGNDPDVGLLPDSLLDDREGPHRWTFDGRTLVMTWLSAKEPGKFVRITAQLSGDGRSYEGTYKNGTRVWGRKLSDAGGPGPAIRRVRVTVGAGGACDLLVDAGAGEAGPEPRQGEMKLAGLSEARVAPDADGRLDILHVFRETRGIADFGKLAGSAHQPMQGLSLNRTDGTLVLTPVPAPGEPRKSAVFGYPRYLKLPATVTLDLERFPAGTLAIQVEKIQPHEVLAVRVMRDGRGARVNATWHPLDRGTQKRGDARFLFDQPIEPGRPAVHGFQLPDNAVSSDDRFALKVSFTSETPAALRSMEVEARVVPYFGAALDADQATGVLVVKSLMKGSPAERSGLRQGDVILSIGGTRTKDLKEALSLLGQIPIGEQAKVEVSRVGKPVEISIKAE